MKETNKLIIAPHGDDEALGCAGVLDKNSYVLFCSSDNQRFFEIDKAAQYIGYESLFIGGEENKLDILQVINTVEYWIQYLGPSEIYIPHPGFHQDHQITFEACLAALRPHENHFFVKKVLVYEGVHDFVWSDEPFIPNYFIPIDIDAKITLFSFYESQIKRHRSTETIRQIAALRGAMSNLPYAEAYQIKRWVE